MYLVYYILGIILVPAIILSIYAQIKVSSTYEKYSHVLSSRNLTGLEVSKLILNAGGISNVEIIEIPGTLTDYYDSKNKVLALSKQNFSQSSVSSIAVAAHECGHALQDANNYFPNKLRNFAIGFYNISSKLLMPLIIIGLLFDFLLLIPTISNIILISGIVVFGSSFLLNLFTLPVEFNASNRALRILEESSIFNSEEMVGAKKVLNSAALTYVASFVYSALNFLRFLLLFIGRRRD